MVKQSIDNFNNYMHNASDVFVAFMVICLAFSGLILLTVAVFALGTFLNPFYLVFAPFLVVIGTFIYAQFKV